MTISLKHVGLEASLTIDDDQPGDTIGAVPENDTELTEGRMRRALGLGGSAASRTLTIKDAAAPATTPQAAASLPSSQRGRSAERIGIRVQQRQHPVALVVVQQRPRQRHGGNAGYPQRQQRPP